MKREKIKRERKLRSKGEYFRERERRVLMVGGGERERERRGQVVTWNSAATAHRGGDTRGGTRTVSGTCDLHVWCGVKGFSR